MPQKPPPRRRLGLSDNDVVREIVAAVYDGHARAPLLSPEKILDEVRLSQWTPGFLKDFYNKSDREISELYAKARKKLGI